MYNELYEIWKAEKELLDIQRLPNKFYAKIVDYIRKMKEENRMLDRKTTKAKLMATEFEYVQFMVCDLFDLRYKKLKEKTLNQETISRDVLTVEEAKMCGTILPLAEHYNAFCKDVLRGQLASAKKDAPQKVAVLRFVQDIPALVGSDLKTYGPFAPEDIATLPPENARVLIKQGVAVAVDAK